MRVVCAAACSLVLAFLSGLVYVWRVQSVVLLFLGNDYFARGKLYRGNHKYLPGSQKFQK